MKHRGLAWVVGVILSSAGFAQGDPATIERIISIGKSQNQAGELLRHLTKSFGARRTGSQALARSQLWVAEQLRSYGWKNVRLEKWGDVHIGFERGRNMSARMVEPVDLPMVFSSAAWTAGTDGPRRAEAVLQPATLTELEGIKDQLRGKWIVMRRLVAMRAARRMPPMTAEAKLKDPEGAELERVDQALDAFGIGGRVYGGENKRDLVHTHGTWEGLSARNMPQDVRVNIGYSDMARIRRNLRAGKRVVLEFNVDQKLLPEPVPQTNVIAELPGTDKADEKVIFGGHLDSWDGPGSEGASDNGSGSMISLEAARLLAAANARPRRTMQIMLFSGEEQGLLGSIAYVKAQGDAIKKVSIAVIEDAGSNWQSQISALPQWKSVFERALADTNRAFPDKHIKVTEIADGKWPGGGGTDHTGFLQAGVPGVAWGKAGPQDYQYIWHTQNDTFENTVPAGLVQMSVNTALFTYNLACADEMVWRPEKLPTATVPTPAGGHDHDHDHP